jgi:glucokinase
MYLGIEIGATKLQIGLGRGDGRLLQLHRESVDVTRGPAGIRDQIAAAVPRLLSEAGIPREQLKGVGIGFGGPVDDATRSIIKSHQIEGWDGFPLADWVSDIVKCPAILGNDSDVAGLAEALFGAGKGLSPVFYFNIGSGIGGGLIIDGEIYRGCGRGAAEFGHLKVMVNGALVTLEDVASGWSIARRAHTLLASGQGKQSLLAGIAAAGGEINASLVGQAAADNDAFARSILNELCAAIGQALRHVMVLLCPRRIVLGGGVSLLGEVLFEPLRRDLARLDFTPFAGITGLVPAALGEEVVVHGALALARRAFPAADTLATQAAGGE